jgi:DNA-binding MarR family transcriptional regulator
VSAIRVKYEKVSVTDMEPADFSGDLIGFAADGGDNGNPYPPGTLAQAPIKYNAQLVDVAEEIYRVRRKRDVQFEQLFGRGLFGDPAWDMLLDLYVNDGRKKSISVSSACLASGAPSTTALRYIAELVRRNLVVRSPHPNDGRVFVLQLTVLAVNAMERLLGQHAKMQKSEGDRSGLQKPARPQ